MSARHQVKRLDRPFEELETGPAEEISFFVRCGSFSSAISPAIFKAQVKFGPDVFADALVPNAAAVDARRLDFPKSLFAMSQRSVPKRVYAGFTATIKPPFKSGR